jgi:DNA-binding CsgD family transcriptional regulator
LTTRQARAPTLEGIADAAVEAAARHLIGLADAVPASGVLIDLTIDGTRCLLTRVVEVAPELQTLSPREQEIARMVGRGYTNKEIAKVLEISSWTVSTHLRRIFSKLDVTTRAAMVAKLLNGPQHAEAESPGVFDLDAVRSAAG